MYLEENFGIETSENLVLKEVVKFQQQCDFDENNIGSH